MTWVNFELLLGQKNIKVKCIECVYMEHEECFTIDHLYKIIHSHMLARHEDKPFRLHALMDGLDPIDGKENECKNTNA